MKKILSTLALILFAGGLYALPPTPTPTYGPVHGMSYVVSGSKVYIRFQSNVAGWGWIEYGAKNQGCTMVKASMRPRTEGTNFQLYIPLTPVTDYGSYFVNYGVAANASPTPTYIWTKSCNLVWYGETGTPTPTPTFTGYCAANTGTCTFTNTPTYTFTNTFTFTPTYTFTLTFTDTFTPTYTFTPTFTFTNTPTCELTGLTTFTMSGSCDSAIIGIHPNHVPFVIDYWPDTSTAVACVSFAVGGLVTIGGVDHAHGFDCGATFFWDVRDAVTCAGSSGCTLGPYDNLLCACTATPTFTPTFTPCLTVEPISSPTPGQYRIKRPDGCGAPATILGPPL